MAAPSNAEQYFLELVNRARMAPVEEETRQGVDLNRNLAPGTISYDPKAPFAFNPLLIDAARDHSAWMFDANTFSHTGENGSSAGQRIQDAGYQLTGSWAWGENLALASQGASSSNYTLNVTTQHNGLYGSEGHRENLMSDSFKEIGIGHGFDQYTFSNGNTALVGLVTHKFARVGFDSFISGVVYDDTDGDDFYSIGEGIGGVNVALSSGGSVATWGSGGYSHRITSPGTYTLTFSGASVAAPVQVAASLSGINAKIDLVDDDTILTSVGVTLGQNAANVTHLGLFGATSTGNDADNVMTGAGATDIFTGAGGNDVIDGAGGSGDIAIFGGDAAEYSVTRGTDGAITVAHLGADGADGTDTLRNVEIARFGDGAEIDLTAATIDNPYSPPAPTFPVTDGNDNIIGTSGDDEVSLLGGADRFIAGEGHDTVHGDGGDDTIYGQGGDDSILGGVGNDLIISSDGMDTVHGGTGSDRLYGGFDDDLMFGGTGYDQIVAGTGNDTLHGEEGNDRIFGEVGNDDITGGDGLDVLVGSFGFDTIRGGEGNDFLYGGADDDDLGGDVGNDQLVAGSGNDLLHGNDGDDRLFGENGGDVLNGDAGDDVLVGGTGEDTLLGGDDHDFLYGGADNDTIRGENGNDQVVAGTGDDSVTGDAGNDRLFGENGHDIMEGGSGADTLVGSVGDDTLSGGDGDDQIFGGFHQDQIDGGAGADYLAAGSGNDTVDGGAGNDQIVLGDGLDVIVFAAGDGADYVFDFDAAQDKIDLSAYNFGSVAAVNFGPIGATSSRVDLGGGDQLTLAGVDPNDLGADTFLI